MLMHRSLWRWFTIADPTGTVAFVAAAALLVIGGCQILQARDQALAEAERGIVTLGHALAEHAKRSIEAVDLTLLETVEQVEAGRETDGLAASLRRRKAMLAQARNVIVIASDGTWIADGVAPHAPVNSADRSYFRWHRDHADRGLHVDDPVIGRTSGQKGLPLTRRIDGPGGSFGGLVVVTLAPEYFESFYRTVATGVQGTVAMWTSDGHPLFRFPALTASSPDFASASAAKAYVAGSASLQSRSPFDGIERRTVFMRVDDLPLVVSTSISTADALTNWSVSAGREAIVLVGVAIVLVLVGIGLRAHRRRLRLLQERSRAADERYRLLAEHATDMITHMDHTGRRLFVTSGSRDLLGYAPEELVGTNPVGMVHPDDAEELRAMLADLAVGQRDRAVNVNRLRHKDGRWIWVEASLRQLRDDEGRAIGFVAAIRNVTDRKLAQEALQASEARYRVLAEATTDVITQIGPSMMRQYVSPSCHHLLGFEPEEMMGLRLSDGIHPDEADDVRALGARLFAGEVEGDRVVTTYRTAHERGHWVWVEAGMNLVRDPVSGAPLSLICSLRDVTVRQEAAQQLERARAAAEHAAQVKSDFVANMSHELRTPLTGMLGINDLLRRDPTLSVSQKRLVELASDAGASLLAIVNDVLDFSKMEAGQLKIESIPFDLYALVASCRDITSGGLAGKPVEITSKLQPGSPRWLVGDPTRLRQILLNLVTNAVKFTERGHVEVSVAYDEDRGRLRIDVLDTGIGIPADRVDTLFDRFTQADTSMTRRYGGTGLGLAISRRLIGLMQGRIGAENRAQGGARFWFELPVTIHEEGDQEAVAAPATSSSGSVHHILLAEDNAINAEIIARSLEARGYAVTIVPDGASAVQAFAGDVRFRLILMDLQMPVMDGLTATAEIRRREATAGGARLPIIGLTANATAGDAARCLAAGMTAHVAKPVVWSNLFTTLDRLVGEASVDVVAPLGSEDDASDLDVATLDDLAAVLGRTRLADHLDRFTSGLPALLEVMMEADAEGLARQAHSLTSSAGHLGFLRLSKLARAIERRSHEGSPALLMCDLRAATERATVAAKASLYAGPREVSGRGHACPST